MAKCNDANFALCQCSRCAFGCCLRKEHEKLGCPIWECPDFVPPELKWDVFQPVMVRRKDGTITPAGGETGRKEPEPPAPEQQTLAGIRAKLAAAKAAWEDKQN